VAEAGNTPPTRATPATATAATRQCIRAVDGSGELPVASYEILNDTDVFVVLGYTRGTPEPTPTTPAERVKIPKEIESRSTVHVLM
jgi:hypothetical protein